ncbi:MAG: hypothetical protein ACR2MA_01775 [Egibacteraceae bacterium]
MMMAALVCATGSAALLAAGMFDPFSLLVLPVVAGTHALADHRNGSHSAS